MKKGIFLVMTIITILMLAQFSMLIGSVRAKTITGSDGDVSWSFDSETGTLIFSGSGEITNKWKDTIDKSNIKSVKIQNGIDKISDTAFSECNAIESVTISNSVTSIGNILSYFVKMW